MVLFKGIDGIPGAKGDKGDNGLKGLDVINININHDLFNRKYLQCNDIYNF